VSLVQKEYFRLEEVARDLGLSGSDVIYLAETGQLRLSIRVFGLEVEKGYIEEEGGGRWFTVPDDWDRWTGLLDIGDRDAHEILKTGTADIHSFHAPEGRYCCCRGGTEFIAVTTLDLLVRLSERKALELRLRRQAVTADPPEQPPPLAAGFVHSPDYRIVQLGGEIYSLGQYQAAVVRILHEAALAGHAWCKGVDILAEIDCNTLRMSDLFKSKPGWRRLIESNSRGMYRLALPAKP
jgi:hypothetical protein